MSAVHAELAVCVIPGCATPVDQWGQPCQACLSAFGAWLRPSDDAPLRREEITARDAYVERAYVMQHQTRSGRRR